MAEICLTLVPTETTISLRIQQVPNMTKQDIWQMTKSKLQGQSILNGQDLQ